MLRRPGAGAEVSSVRVLLYSYNGMDGAVNRRLHQRRSTARVHQPRKQPSPVVIYLHGGGLISDFRAVSQTFVGQWAEQTRAPILYLDYSLCPENSYPTALNECYELYKWVAAGQLGVHPTSIVVVGESVGGNLAAAMCVRAVQDRAKGVRVPDALVLAYPILNLQPGPTPSRALFMVDAVLPMNLLSQCRSVYVPSQCDPATDPTLSPVIAADAILAHFPPTSIVVGGLDPFLDDSVDLAHRLHANGVTCRLKVMPGLPHSFLQFAYLLPAASEAVELMGRWIMAGF